MTDVIVLGRAEAEVFGRYEWLHGESPERAGKFDDDMSEAIFMLAHHPEIASRWRRSPLRCYRLHRWNFGLFYAIEGRRVVIVAAQDLRQDPESIQRRLGLT